MNSAKEDSIKVFCRVRPSFTENDTICEYNHNHTSIQHKDTNALFSFDKIFHEEINQESVFQQTAQNIVKDVLNGINATIFAYGQTGSGKTWTMMGDIEDDRNKGITPRIIQEIFKTIINAPSSLEFTVKVSYLEIYMEKIRDLLKPCNNNLSIHEDKLRGVYVKDLLHVFTGSIDEVYEVLKLGQKSRATASTLMNEESSRSHAIFSLTVSQKNIETGVIRTGKLSLVDLAGSEKVGKTGATGTTLEEAKTINKSLSALGNVINALTDGKASHIPYRDSKLTRILKESIGGNSRTTLIVNCSSASFNAPETISTLRFGIRAKSIKNSVRINAELSPSEMKFLLKKAKADITVLQNYTKLLESELSQWRAGIPVHESQITAFNPFSISDFAIKDFPSIEIQSSNTADEDILPAENEIIDATLEIENNDLKFDSRIELLEHRSQALEKNEYELLNTNEALREKVEKLELLLESHDRTSKDQICCIENLEKENQHLSHKLELANCKIIFDNEQIKISQISPAAEETKVKMIAKKFEQPALPSKSLDESSAFIAAPKMKFLESRLQELSSVQKKLVDQNISLKNEITVTREKLSKRAERIKNLELQLHKSEDRFNSRPLITRDKVDLKEYEPNWMYSSKIAKPLRGGVSETSEDYPVELNSFNEYMDSPQKKRSSWYVSLLRTQK